MKAGKPYLVIVVAGLGFAAGFAMHRSTPSTSMPPDHDPVLPKRGTAESQIAGGDAAPVVRSTDSIQDLLAADRASFAGRLSLWLLDASTEDIAAFWDEFRHRDRYEADHWDKVVLFRRWTQLDPEGAMAAAKRDGAEEAALWGRAMHDPKAVLPEKPDYRNRLDSTAIYAVMRFNPDLAIEMIKKDPNMIAETDPDKLARELAGDDPEKAMRFLVEHGQTHLTEPLQRWTREDPDGVLAWLRSRWGEGSLKDDFLAMLTNEHPGLAQEFAATLPEGAIKRDLQQLAFRELLKSDPAAALAAARAEAVPQPEQFAACARAMVSSDPQAALGLMIELFRLNPDATTWVIHTADPSDPTGFRSEKLAGPSELVGDLMAWDPAATMAAAMEMPGEKTLLFHDYYATDEHGVTHHEGADLRSLVAAAWVKKDPQAFADWCDSQEDQTLRTSGLTMVCKQFDEQGDYPQALQWALELAAQKDSADLAVDTFKNWSTKDREEAANWLEQTDLSEEMRKALQQTLKPAKP